MPPDPDKNSPQDQEDLRRQLEHLQAVIEEYQAREASTREAEKRLRAVVESSPVVFFAMDAEGYFTLSEGKGLENLGLEPNQVVGMSAFEMYADTPRILNNIRKCLG